MQVRKSGSGNHVLTESPIGQVQVSFSLQECDVKDLNLTEDQVNPLHSTGPSENTNNSGIPKGGKMYTGDYEHEYPNRVKKYDEQQIDEAARAILKNQTTLYKANNNFGVINEED